MHRVRDSGQRVGGVLGLDAGLDELAVHGWWHPTPREAENWTYEQAKFVFAYCKDLFVHGFKAPGWQISDETYRAAIDEGWWIADHWENDARRPEGADDQRRHPRGVQGRQTPITGTGTSPTCRERIEETFTRTCRAVLEAEHFESVSESVAPWK